MAVVVTYQTGWKGARVIKGVHDGRPKLWTVTATYDTGTDGRRKLTIRVKEPCGTAAISDHLDLHLQVDSALYGGCKNIRWTAISR